MGKFLLALVAILTTLVPARAQEEVRFWHALRGSRGEALHRLVEDYNRNHPGPRIVAIFKGAEQPGGNDYAALNRALLESLALGQPPDLAQVYENWTPQLLEIGALAPLDGFFEGPDGLTAGDQQDFVTVFRQANLFQGRLVTLPFNKSIYVLYYNRPLFEKLGLSPPQSYQALGETARIIHAKTGLPGLVAEPTVDLFGHYLVAHGGSFVVDNRAVFGGPLGEQGMSFWARLASEHSSVFAPDASERFGRGQAGMYIETTSKLASLERHLPGLGVAPLPRGSASAVQAAGTNLAIFARATPAAQKAAWGFVRWVTSPEITSRWATETGYLPVRLSAIQSADYKAFLKQHPNYAVGLSELSNAVVQPRTPAWESIRGILDDALTLSVSGKLPPGEAVQRALALANEVLTRMQGKP